MEAWRLSYVIIFWLLGSKHITSEKKKFYRGEIRSFAGFDFIDLSNYFCTSEIGDWYRVVNGVFWLHIYYRKKKQKKINSNCSTTSKKKELLIHKNIIQSLDYSQSIVLIMFILIDQSKQTSATKILWQDHLKSLSNKAMRNLEYSWKG